MSFTRDAILRRLHDQRAAGKIILGVGAGTGISAKFEEAGGADLIIIYNSGRYRMAGRGSLAGLLGAWMIEVVDALAKGGDTSGVESKVREEVKALTARFPIYSGPWG